MTIKILWFDVETTGLDYIKNDPIQIAGIVEIDGDIKEEFEILLQPINYDNISLEALKVNGFSVDRIKTFQSSREGYSEFVGILGKYVDKFNKNDKFYPAGYNVRFDIDMVASLFKKNGDNYLGSWWNWRGLDPLQMLYVLDFEGRINLPNYKLETVCAYFEIDIDAHDAVSDIRATRELYRNISGSLLKTSPKRKNNEG